MKATYTAGRRLKQSQEGLTRNGLTGSYIRKVFSLRFAVFRFRAETNIVIEAAFCELFNWMGFSVSIEDWDIK